VFLASAALEAARVVLIDNTATGRGLPGIFNEHKRAATADWLVFCHQDFVVFQRDWIERIAGLRPDACYGPIGIDRTGRFLGRIRQTDESWLGLAVDGADVVGLDEVCLVVPRAVYEAVDFDERFPFDLYVHDYCLAAREAGFGVKTLQLECQHRSKSLTGDVARESYRRAKAAYIAKHQVLGPLLTTTFQWKPSYWSDPEQTPTLRAELALIPSGSHVLEVGTAAGHMTRALRRKGCQVTGIEVDEERARLAAPLCQRMVVGNVEDLDLDAVVPERFDVVLCGDVLEHLKDPEPVLAALQRRLAPGGHLVVSLPHVAHGSVRLSLLEGRFPYAKEGLLDATHLRFFTLESLAGLFERAGFEIGNLHRTRIGLFDTEIPLDPSRLAPSTVRRVAQDPEATTYQFVFRAFPSSRSAEPHDLRDRTFDPRQACRALAATCMGRAWSAFHRHPPSRREARAWARLAMTLAPSVKAAVYWVVSFLPLPRAYAGRRR
jgi:2-polyprenyl-3-methyl-5-hydroxy-6-metoxy-1,4-benzoquinol methylase